ncbi:MAG: hypothetical protein ABWY20_20255 [Mycobacterium sp.]
MSIHTTPIYGLAYIDVDTPLEDLAVASQQNAATVETALAAGGLAPPNTPDLAAAIGRIAALEGSAPVAVPFVNLAGAATGWSNFANPGFASLRVWKQGRTVRTVGVIKNGAAIGASTQQAVARVPVGFRPPSNESVMVSTFANGAVAFRFDVTADGVITAVNNNAATIPIGAYIPCNAAWSVD